MDTLIHANLCIPGAGGMEASLLRFVLRVKLGQSRKPASTPQHVAREFEAARPRGLGISPK